MSGTCLLSVKNLLGGAMLATTLFGGQTGTAKGQTLGTAEFRNVLMPEPARLTRVTGELSLSAAWRVDESLRSARLDRAVTRTLHQMSERTGVRFDGERGTGARLVLAVGSEGEQVQSLDEDESYALVVDAGGVRITANTVPGAMHGLETMLQLVQPGRSGYEMPFVTIEDAPRFRWRGLMIDCGRHFEPVSVLKRTLDGMAAVKLNVFHWHLTEDQGFRIESRRFPRLTAAGSDGLFYTQEEAREIVRYAHDRGIRVVPEFEMPGHSTAWLVAYPELSSGKGPEGIRREFGISEYALDPTREETYTFISGFLSEMAGIFPDAYVHVGGDETPAPDWKTSSRIRSFMSAHGLKDSDALQAYFNQRVLTILTGLQKRMIGWDEILNPALPKDVIVQSWRGEESLIRGAKLGYQGVLSAPYYLDAMKPAGQHYLADPLLSTADLTPEQRRLILGGEVCMWAEHIDERTIDSRVWPRTAAIAERFWSPEKVRDVEDMYRRLHAVSIELEGLGLRHLSQEGVGLRQLAGTEHIEALRVFASVLEPVSFSERYQQQKTSQITVLDRFVDAVRPDASSRREIATLTTAFLQSPQGDVEARDRLLGRFEELRAAVPEVKEQMKGAPRLRDVEARADQLTLLAEAGSEAVRMLSAGQRAPVGWKAGKAGLLKRAGEPSAIVRFTMLDSLRDLFAAVEETQ
jgi:hexosaminidase